MKFLDLIAAIPAEAGLSDLRAGNNPQIQRISEDSRLVQAGDLFIARSGTKLKGGEFAQDAIAKGAVAVISDQPLEWPAGTPSARVARANLALGFMAQRLAGDPAKSIRTVAVTGTKGKTTVTYLLRSILKAAGKKCGLIGTVEIDDGARVVPSDMTTPGPLELAALMTRMRDESVHHCVMEVSSHALHQDRIAGLPIAVGLFTNLTGDHLDYHGTMDAYGDAKAILFERLTADAVAVANADDTWAVARIVRDTKARIVRYGITKPKSETGKQNSTALEWQGRIESMTSLGTQVSITGPNGKSWTLSSPLVGRHNVYNSLCAIAAADALGISHPHIIEGLENMPGVPGRLQAVRLPSDLSDALGFQVFVDYAHTHDALENVLTAVRATMGHGRLICVFGCGGDRDRTKRPKMAAIAQRLADEVVVTSDNPRTEMPGSIIQEILAGFVDDGHANVEVRTDRREAIRLAIELANAGDVVLIAGKGHENYQIVGKTKQHFDDVEEAAAAMTSRASDVEKTGSAR